MIFVAVGASNLTDSVIGWAGIILWIALFWVCLALLVIAVATTVSILERQGRARGQRSYKLVAVVAVSLWMLALMIISSIGKPVDEWMRTDIGIVLGFITSALMTGIVLIAFAAILPPRRRSGLQHPRMYLTLARFMKMISRLFRWAAFPLTIWVWWWVRGWEGPIWESIVFIAVTVLMIFIMCNRINYLADRIVPPNFTDVRKADSRPPILYLREFREEEAFFIAGLTVEEFLGPEIKDTVGPLVALGSPKDRVAPEGAVRVYCDDATWKSQAHSLMSEASGIILIPSSSTQISWELKHLLTIGAAWKLCLLIPPEMHVQNQIITRHPHISRWRSAVKTALSYYFWEHGKSDDEIIAGSSLGNPPSAFSSLVIPSPDEIVNLLQEAGLTLSQETIRAGSVIGFDAEGRGAIIASDLHSANDYVKAIKLHLGMQPNESDAAA